MLKMTPIASPRHPLGALSLNRTGQAKASSKTPKKHHSSKASLEIGKDGRALINISYPYPSAKTRARAATICQRSDKERQISTSGALSNKRGVPGNRHSRRQSTTAVEADDLEALIAKYTALNDEELLYKSRAVQTPFLPPATMLSEPVITRASNLPFLAAPEMQRSPLPLPMERMPTQKSINVYHDPFPYSPILEETSYPVMHSSPDWTHSLGSTPTNSLFSSLSSNQSHPIPISAPFEELTTMIHNLQDFLPYASTVPQYKLNTLQESVNLLLSVDEPGYAPSAYQHNTSLDRQPYNHSPITKIESKNDVHQGDMHWDFTHHVPQSLIFVYEDGRGGESYLPTW